MSLPLVNRDEEHVKLLSIFHYVMGGIVAFFACFGLFYVLMGLMVSVLPQGGAAGGPNQPPPAWFGALFSTIGGVIVLVGWTLATLIALSGRFLARRRNYVFCMVVAIVECLWVPFGTVLGVFTIVVLLRPNVQSMFGQQVSVT